MEILKKLLFALLILSAGRAFSQSDEAMQRAFRNSYANEGKKNYQGAITDVMPFYSDGNYELNLRLGWLNYINKNYTTSQSYYLKAVRLKPSAIEAKFGYIKPLSFLQSWDRVMEQYNDILKIDAQNTQANYWAGVIYYNRKQYDAAVRCFRIVVNLYPFDYDGNHMLAWSNLMAGRKTEARQLFLKALLIKPDDESSTDGLSRTK